VQHHTLGAAVAEPTPTTADGAPAVGMEVDMTDVRNVASDQEMFDMEED
jgi:hypothetical protein